jgi:catechol 2,3-dioxygenase-like lactoylglutathione lyase family enzyme
MFNSISHSGIYVLDQDQAVDFYVGKLGLEVSADFDLGFMRWLTVSVPGNPGHNILLQKPGPPMLTDEVAAQVRDLVTKGALGLSLILTTDDCRNTYQELKAKGVEFLEEPTEQPYGIDCGFRDPFGNQGRITQPAPEMAEITDDVKERWAEGGPDPIK